MRRFFVHFCFWLLILFWSSTIYDYNGKYGWAFVQLMAIRLPLIIGVTYFISHYLLPRYLIKKKEYFAFGSLATISFLYANLLDRVILGQPIVGELIGKIGLNYTFFNEIPILRNAFLLLSIIALVSGVRFFKILLEKERLSKELQKENLSIKLSLLRSQMNPHFTYNALNNLYSLATQNSDPDTADGIEHLSKIMKYLTYHGDADLVPLSTEIEMIESYIHMQYLGIDESDDTIVTFQNDVENIEHRVPPVLLLPLIENAFKHGVVAGSHSRVAIGLSDDQGRLSLTIENTTHQETHNQIPSGRGLNNLKKRLDILYPSAHVLHLQHNMDMYITHLEIPLQS